MKPNQLFTSMLAVTALFATACSAPKLANKANQDDVYNTKAQAKEYLAQAPVVGNTQPDTITYDYYGSSDPRFSMDYSSRIDRFYYASPWRTYYDNYYGGNAYYSPYDGFYYPFNSYALGGPPYNNFFGPYSFWASYINHPYYSNYWGPYSFYSYYPYYRNYYGGFGGGYLGNYYGGYYGGYYGNGYYGNGGGYVRGAYNASNSPRPSRSGENGLVRTNNGFGGGSSSIPSRANGNPTNSNGITRSRAEMYNPATNNATTSTRGSGTSSSAPSRGSSNNDSRPTRSNDVQAPRSAPTYNPPAQSSPPPSSSSSGGGSRAESGSSSGGGGGRPTRGGR